jgi:hypothetical protein
MEIRYEKVPDYTRTLEQFADEHGLVMLISERAPTFPPHLRYTAKFESCEVKDGCMLTSLYGEGSSPKFAMEAYARNISRRLLVHKATSPERREIRVPVLKDSVA